MKKKLWLALIALCGLALAAWRLLDDMRFRWATWLVLALFALRIVMLEMHQASDERVRQD
ncbi:MAG: hypothetical protein HYX26_04575 [Acidobacteriales bacterium]|nr:hypothetical protein [Terriglobales bacterium]